MAIGFVAKFKALEIVEAIIDVVTLVITVILPNIGKKIEDDSPGGSSDWYQRLLVVTAVANQALSLGHTIYGWIHTASWVFRMAIDVGVTAAKTAAGGIPSLVETLALKLLGSAMVLLSTAAGTQLFAYGDVIFAGEDAQQRMDLVDWCNTYGAGECGALPTN